MNLKTGHISPQFHVVFYPSFHTTHPSTRRELPESLWQNKCGFRGEQSLMSGAPVGGDPNKLAEPTFISPTNHNIPRGLAPQTGEDREEAKPEGDALGEQGS